MKNLILVRHGQTELNAQNKLQGWIDAPLTQRGRETASQLHQVLATVPLTKTYTSDRERAEDTASLILGQRQPLIPITTQPLLREYYFGALEGQDESEILRAFLRKFGLRQTLVCTRRGSGFPQLIKGFAALDQTKQAETYQDFKDRAQQLLTQYATDPTPGNVLVVAHGLLLSMMIHLIAPADLPAFLLKNTSVSILTKVDDHFQAQGINLTDSAEIQRQLNPK
ncbi:histidine phosphatase family protein [Lapidilactobacillus luobeiensis]|uniref:histidine phosphatase family protein n=1 Tax=Lapidilactobacillus luobeiensis TaxID=2950371 RepID=UPI0021C43961|nr:histidine phosphatase family protein [Lapidilactobacillus luobeiensis]